MAAKCFKRHRVKILNPLGHIGANESVSRDVWSSIVLSGVSAIDYRYTFTSVELKDSKVLVCRGASKYSTD